MTPVTREGRRCCERYDALMARLPDYEAAVEALERLAPKDALESLGDDELISVSWPDVHYRAADYRAARAALARLREQDVVESNR